MKNKVLKAEEIAKIIIECKENTRFELYTHLINEIKKFKEKVKDYDVSDNDINNVLAKLIKDSTDIQFD